MLGCHTTLTTLSKRNPTDKSAVEEFTHTLSYSIHPGRVVACPNQHGSTGMCVLWKMTFYPLALVLQWFETPFYNIFLSNHSPCLMFLAYHCGQLFHSSFHTTLTDKEIFYHHYCPGFKPYSHHCGQAASITEYYYCILSSHLWVEGKLLSNCSLNFVRPATSSLAILEGEERC